MYEEYTSNEQITLVIDSEAIPLEKTKLEAAISGLPCAIILNVHEQSVEIDYCPGVVSRAMIVEALQAEGFPEKKVPTPGALEARLNRMAASTQKAFGSGPLDCCNLNSKRPSG